MRVGLKIKQLVESKYSGTKKQFAADIGLKNHTYLHKLFLKDNLSTAMLSRIAAVLNVDVVDIIRGEVSQVNEEQAYYQVNLSEKKELEILRKRIVDLERIVKMQDGDIDTKELLIDKLEKEIVQLKKTIANKSK